MATAHAHPAAQQTAGRTTKGDHWAELMLAAQAGNGGAYNRLLTEVSGWLHRFYIRRLPTALVEDVVQEALIALHTKRHTYEAGRPFKPWLAAIARYKWIDRLRIMQRTRSEPLEDHDLALADHGSSVTSSIALNALLSNLKPAQAGVIRLVKLNGLSIEEASEATGQSIPLVKVNIHRGLARLTKLIEAEASPES